MGNPDLNWGYQSTPQEQLLGRQIDCSRGKTLGGSSETNFQAWARGPRDDYEEWAKRVGDVEFNWENAQRLYKKIENFDIDPGPLSEYFKPNAGEHGNSGPINIEGGDQWPEGLRDALDGITRSGVKKNPDLNSGDPLGFGLIPSIARKGLRVTAKAYTDIAPSNLTMKLEMTVTKLGFEGKKVIGVETVNGRCEFRGHNFSYSIRLLIHEL